MKEIFEECCAALAAGYNDSYKEKVGEDLTKEKILAFSISPNGNYVVVLTEKVLFLADYAKRKEIQFNFQDVLEKSSFLNYKTLGFNKDEIVGFIGRYKDPTYWGDLHYMNFYMRRKTFDNGKINIRKQVTMMFEKSLKIRFPLDEFKTITQHIQFKDPSLQGKVFNATKALHERYSNIGMVLYDKFQYSLKLSEIILKDGTTLKISDDLNFIRHIATFLASPDSINFPRGMVIDREFLVKNLSIKLNHSHSGYRYAEVHILKEGGPKRGVMYLPFTKDHLEQASDLYNLDQFKEFAGWKLKWIL